MSPSILSLGFFVFSVACGGGTVAPPVDVTPTTTITVTGAPSGMVPGEQATLTWQVRNSDGSVASNQDVTFTSNATTRVTVSASGVVSAVSPGSATIRLAQGTASSDVRLEVEHGGIIDAAGSIIAALGGQLRLEVPPGAVSRPTRVLLRAASNPLLDPTEVVGSVVNIGPDSLRFSAPVVVRLAFNASLGPVGLPPAAFRLRVFAASEWKEAADAVTDAAQNIASGTVRGAGNLSVGWVLPAAPCTSVESRQFDFWIGRWNVTEFGQPAGLSDITVAPGGCAIFEHFRSAGVGRSISFYEVQSRKWYQTYVDDAGFRVLFAGSFVGGNMDLITPAGAGQVYGLTRWSAEGVNARQQVSMLTRNGGATYEAPRYNLLYIPR